jgi:hypothetical protein
LVQIGSFFVPNMADQPDISAAKPSDWARALYERQIAISGELAEDGLEITKALKAEILAAPADEATQATVMAYGRAARSVRLSILLQARLVRDLEAHDRGPQVPSAIPGAPLFQIQRIIVDPADRETEVAENPERMAGETCERLDQEDLRRFGEAAALVRSGRAISVRDETSANSSPPRVATLPSGAPVGCPSAALENTLKGPAEPIDQATFKSSA